MSHRKKKFVANYGIIGGKLFSHYDVDGGSCCGKIDS